MFILPLLLALSASQVISNPIPAVELKNAAQPNTLMPVVGVGVGGYGNCTVACDIQPLCFWSSVCPQNPYNAVRDFLSLGGSRIDGAIVYFNNDAVGRAMRDSNVKRENIFLTNKVGTLGMGYNTAHSQFQEILNDTQLDYVDLLLIHEPRSSHHSDDKACQTGTSTYNETQCRLETWKALEEIFESGKAKAIGVSNYNRTHIQEIIDTAKYLPSVNQCPYHNHLTTLQQPLLEFCKKHNILFNGYSPLGRPNQLVFPPAVGTTTLLQEPLIIEIGKKHNATAAQVMQNWQWYEHGVVVNPRSSNKTHMALNIDTFVNPFKLSVEEVKQLNSMPEDTCNIDPTNYECGGTEQHF